MPTWLDSTHVVTAVGEELGDQVDAASLQFWCDTVRDHVEDRRPDLYVAAPVPEDPPVFTPSDRVRGGAALLAFRLYSRREAPLGVRGIKDILLEDPDIGRMLGIGRHRRFRFGAPRDPEPVEVV